MELWCNVIEVMMWIFLILLCISFAAFLLFRNTDKKRQRLSLIILIVLIVLSIMGSITYAILDNSFSYDRVSSESSSSDTYFTSTSSQIASHSSSSALSSSVTSSNPIVPIVLYDDANVTISFVSARTKSVVFDVNNKTKYPMTFQIRSLAFDGESNLDNFVFSERIAPASKKRVTLDDFDGYIDTSKLEKASGQFAVAIDRDELDVYEPYFVDVKLK